MNKPLDYVFIDTSIFKNQGYFKKSGAVYRLFDLAEAGWIRILMPDIAKRVDKAFCPGYTTYVHRCRTKGLNNG